MQKAMDRARAGLEDFLRKAGSPPPNTDQYSVKVRVSEGDQQEYLWVSNLKVQGELWSGRIDNLPMIRSVKKGQSYAFAKTEIIDWTYIDKKEEGCWQFHHLCAPHQRAAGCRRIDSSNGLECDR